MAKKQPYRYRSARFQMFLTTEEHKAWKVAAARRHTSMSQLVREAVAVALKKGR